jgi:hypothetical protein
VARTQLQIQSNKDSAFLDPATNLNDLVAYWRLDFIGIFQSDARDSLGSLLLLTLSNSNIRQWVDHWTLITVYPKTKCAIGEYVYSSATLYRDLQCQLCSSNNCGFGYGATSDGYYCLSWILYLLQIIYKETNINSRTGFRHNYDYYSRLVLKMSKRNFSLWRGLGCYLLKMFTRLVY